MKDFVSGIFKSSQERIKHPFVFSFLLSWIVFNWAAIAILLFSKTEIEERVIYIIDYYGHINNTLLYPLFLSLIYMLILPYFSWGIDIFVQFGKKKHKKVITGEITQDWRNKREIAKEEYRYLQEKTGNVTLKQLNDEIESLKASLANRDKEIEDLKYDLTDSEKERRQLEQLRKLEGSGDLDFDEETKNKLDAEYSEFLKSDIALYFEDIATEVNHYKSVPESIERIVIDKMIFNGLIKQMEDEEMRRIIYTFTNKGKYFWKKHVLDKKIFPSDESELDETDNLPF